jgi:long-chain fatty acid transport protein
LEAGVRWEDWRSFNQLKIDLKQPVNGQSSVIEQKDWRDTYAANFGGKYQVTEAVALMAGYLYNSNPAPDTTFEPAVLASDCHLFTAGTEIKFDNFKVAASYGYQRQVERDKNNAVGALSGGTANGTYDAHLHMLGVSIVYKF